MDNPSGWSHMVGGNQDVVSLGGTAVTQATKQKRGSKRTGKWTDEEAKYATQIIRCFGRKILKLPPNKTVRTYISEELNCDPMRITKKFPGTGLLMKEVLDDNNPVLVQSIVQNALLHLESLKKDFHERLRRDFVKRDSKPLVFRLVSDDQGEDGSSPLATLAAPESDLVQPQKMQCQAALSVTQPSGALAQGGQRTLQTSNVSRGVLNPLPFANAENPLPAALSNPMVLAQLWKTQAFQEEQIRTRRAPLMPLSQPGFASTHCVVHHPTTNSICQAPPTAPQFYLWPNQPSNVSLNSSSFSAPAAAYPSPVAPGLPSTSNNLQQDSSPQRTNLMMPNQQAANIYQLFLNLVKTVPPSSTTPVASAPHNAASVASTTGPVVSTPNVAAAAPVSIAPASTAAPLFMTPTTATAPVIMTPATAATLFMALAGGPSFVPPAPAAAPWFNAQPVLLASAPVGTTPSSAPFLIAPAPTEASCFMAPPPAAPVVTAPAPPPAMANALLNPSSKQKQPDSTSLSCRPATPPFYVGV